MKTTFANLFFYEFIIFVALFLPWVIIKFNTFVALLVATFVSIDSVIPHWFPNVVYQLCFTFVIALIIYFRSYFLPGKKNEEQNNENTNMNNNTGRRIRRRFEKVE